MNGSEGAGAEQEPLLQHGPQTRLPVWEEPGKNLLSGASSCSVTVYDQQLPPSHLHRPYSGCCKRGKWPHILWPRAQHWDTTFLQENIKSLTSLPQLERGHLFDVPVLSQIVGGRPATGRNSFYNQQRDGSGSSLAHDET